MAQKNAMQFATVQPVIARTDLPVITDEEAAALARATVNLFRLGADGCGSPHLTRRHGTTHLSALGRCGEIFAVQLA